MTWLLLWMVLTPMVGAFVLVVSLAVLAAVTEGVESLANSVVAVPFCMLGGGVAGGLLYLINLPFLVVAFRNRFHRERFYHALRLPVSSPLAPEPGNGNPFASNADQIVRG